MFSIYQLALFVLGSLVLLLAILFVTSYLAYGSGDPNCAALLVLCLAAIPAVHFLADQAPRRRVHWAGWCASRSKPGACSRRP